MGIKFVRIKEILKKRAYMDFCTFMDGQTVDVNGVYEDDFIRWINKQGVVD